MTIEVGRIHAIFRYPVKSMAGVAVDAARLDWHGVEGDRRLAFRRLADTGGFPWLTAGRLPELLLYQPVRQGHQVEGAQEHLQTHIRTPAGETFELSSAALREEIAQQHGGEVELMHLKHGIFDEASVSVISLATLRGIERAVGAAVDQRRFRPNIVIETTGDEPFGEDAWVGKTLLLGADDDGAAIAMTMRDKRCAMINLDPDTAQPDARWMKAVVRMSENNAGVYGTVIQTGELRVGQSIRLQSA